MNNKENKIALVTGASSGIGKSMTESLADNGYYVFASARRLKKLEAMKRENIEPLQMDVSDSKAVIEAVKYIDKTKGHLDILVNNAGYGIYGTIEGVKQEDIRKAFDVNVFGLGQVTQAVLPMMRNQKSGLIINISSVVGKISFPFLGWYAATKHAVEGYTDALRVEVKPFGIKVVLIEPGSINTGFEEVAMSTLEKSEDPDVYSKGKKAFTKIVRNSYKSAPGPEAVIKELKKILNSANPRSRYVAGGEGKLFLTLKNILSDRFFDNILSRQYK